MIQISSDLFLQIIFCVLLFGGMSEFERWQNNKYNCPRYCGVAHKHNLGLATSIEPTLRFKIKSLIFMGVTAEKKP